MILIGWALSRAAGLGRPQAFSVAIEVGLQNGALGAFVALTILREPKLAVVPSIYSVVMLLVGSVFVVLYRNATARQELRTAGMAVSTIVRDG
jgi:BASS family bile acid:Na+ symporter